VELNKFLENIGIQNNLREKFKLPSKIYHYTSVSSLYNIITLDERGSNSFYMTDADFSNDSSELLHGFKMINSVLGEHQNNPIEELKYRYFISCFCIEGDDLTQWKCYGKDGEGVCIELDLNPSQDDYFQLLHNSVMPSNVFYHDETKREIVLTMKNIIDNSAKIPDMKTINTIALIPLALFIPLVGSILMAGTVQWLKKVQRSRIQAIEQICQTRVKEIESFFNSFGYEEMSPDKRIRLIAYLFCPSMKHVSYSEEKEFRFIHYKKRDEADGIVRHYLNSRDVIVPYVRSSDLLLPSDSGHKLPISKVIVGSRVKDKKLVIRSIEQYMRSCGYTNPIVIESELTYR